MRLSNTAVRSAFTYKIAILLLWLIEPAVFQIPQLDKHFNAGSNCMVDLNNIKHFTTGRPDKRTLFGDPEAFDKLPEYHRKQILFPDKTASKYIFDFFHSAKLATGNLFKPFKDNFKEVEELSNVSDIVDSKRFLKNWLFNKGIAFQTWVFILPNYNNYPVLTTWKMAIKYCDSIFSGDDITVFDTSLNWCLFYNHEDYLYFGKNNRYDPNEGYKDMETLIEKQKKYPGFKSFPDF